MTEEIQNVEETTQTQPDAKVEKEEADKSNAEEVKEAKEEESVEEEDTSKKPRENRFVPYDKFKEAREQVKNLKAEIEKLSERKPSAGTDEAIEKLSTKYPEVGKEFLQDIISASREGGKLPPDVTEKLQRLEARDIEIAQDKGFEKDFQKLIKDVPEADDPKVKAKLKTLAFTEEFAKAPLKAIFYGHPDEFGGSKPKKSAEPSKGGQANSVDMTFEEVDNLPPEERADTIKKMTPEQYDKFSERMRANNSWKNR